MEVIRYNGENVYTPSNVPVTTHELTHSKVEKGQVEDVYFFEVDGDRNVKKVDFNKTNIDKLNSGLMVQVRGKFGEASVSIARLDRIVSFLCEFGCLGKDLSALKERDCWAFNQGIQLVGISKY